MRSSRFATVLADQAAPHYGLATAVPTIGTPMPHRAGRFEHGPVTPAEAQRVERPAADRVHGTGDVAADLHALSTGLRPRAHGGARHLS